MFCLKTDNHVSLSLVDINVANFFCIMSSCHKVARLLVFISSTLCLHVQDEQLLRRRVTLTELDRGHFVQSLHNVERRDTTNSTNPSTPPVLGHFAHLRNDRHRLAIVHWSGENSSVRRQYSRKTVQLTFLMFFFALFLARRYLF